MQETSNSNDEDDQLTDALENIYAHLLEIYDKIGEEPAFLFPNVAQEDADDYYSSFTAVKNNISVIHALTECTPKFSRYGDSFNGVLSDNGCARGSTGSRTQY